MGVPGFNTWFARNHRHAYVSYLNKSWDHVYIDMASILHGAMKTAHSVPHFHKILFARLDAIMTLASPQKSVMFALDGPAPLAKLLTQRRRRARESIKTLSAPQLQEVRPYTSLVQPLTNARPTAAAARSSALLHQTSGPQQVTHSQNRGSTKPRGLSTMGLTPGTPFMAEIERSLEFYICQRLQRWHHLEFELSGARVQGEGETKIMKRINHSTGSHIVVGNDSDIILMSLMCPVSQLYILSQETKGKSTKYNCISLDALNMRQSSDVLNATLSQGRTASLTGLNMDLVLIAMIAKGNDYLPAVRGVTGSASSLTLWKTYLRLRQLPAWANQCLVIVEQASQTATLNADLLVTLLSQSPARQGRGFTAANLLPPDAQHYAQGLVWVLNMYLQAECPNYRWTHDNEAPNMQQLIQAIKAMKSASSVTPTQESTNTDALLPSVCALSLIPRSGRHHMAPLLQPLMDEGSPVADVFDNCLTCDQLTADNTKVSAEYMKLHAALQAATGEPPSKRRKRGSQQLLSSSESEQSQSVAASVEAPATGGHQADLEHQQSDLAESDTKPQSSGSSTAQRESSSLADDDSEPGGTTSGSDDNVDSSDSELSDLADAVISDAAADSESEDELDTIDLAALRDADIQQMQHRAETLRGQMNSLRHQRNLHLSSAHPYAPFPIDRLEKAVAALPSSSLPSDQQELGTFGQSHTFTWASEKQLATTKTAAFLPQCPTGMNPTSPVSNVIRKPIVESRRPTPAAVRRIVASHQQVLVQSYMPQHQQWQKHPLARSVMQWDAARQQAATMWREMSRMPKLHPYGSLTAHKGLIRHVPLHSSLLCRTGLQRLGFGVLP